MNCRLELQKSVRLQLENTAQLNEMSLLLSDLRRVTGKLSVQQRDLLSLFPFLPVLEL